MPKKEKEKKILYQKLFTCFTPSKVYSTVISCHRKKDGVGWGGGKGGREMEQDSCFFNKLQQKTFHSLTACSTPPAERGRRRQHEKSYFSKEDQAAFLAFSTPTQLTEVLYLSPGSIRTTSQRACPCFLGC